MPQSALPLLADIIAYVEKAFLQELENEKKSARQSHGLDDGGASRPSRMRCGIQWHTS